MNRRQLLCSAAVAAVAGFLTPLNRIAYAATGGTEALVTITKTDGSTVRGKITDYDRDKVTMDVVTKPKDPPVSTTFNWNDIKKISNGLTREKALQKWKGEHHESLCATCHGDGKTFCPTCHGTAHDPAASAGCPSCKGAAQLACTTAKCKQGIIPCPNPKCLKLTDSGLEQEAGWKPVEKVQQSRGFVNGMERASRRAGHR